MLSDIHNLFNNRHQPEEQVLAMVLERVLEGESKVLERGAGAVCVCGGGHLGGERWSSR